VSPGKTVALAETPAGLAFRALLDHVVKCSRCAYNWQQCPTRRALATTVREVRNDY
jgi:hypothetical protein